MLRDFQPSGNLVNIFVTKLLTLELYALCLNILHRMDHKKTTYSLAKWHMSNRLRLMAYGSWLLAFGLWPMAYGLWLMPYALCLIPYALFLNILHRIGHKKTTYSLGKWHMADRLRLMAYGSCLLAFGLWLLAYGLWLMAYALYLIPYALTYSIG